MASQFSGLSRFSVCHISVHRIPTYRERSLTLTFGTSSWLGFLILVLHEGSQDVVTLVTIVLDDRELGEDACGGSHNPACPDQLVQMELAKGPKLLHQRELSDPDVDFLKTINHKSGRAQAVKY